MRRRPLGGAVYPQQLLLALACLLGEGACWRADLPALATRATAASDAATAPEPDATLSAIDAAENVIEVTSGPSDAGQVTGQVALSLSMPVDTSTGQIVPVGSVLVELTASELAPPRALTLELGQPRQKVKITLSDVPAGGPYTLQTSATAGGFACTSSTPPFSVVQTETVDVFAALICAGDAGWSATL